MVDVAKFFMEFCMDESCGKCVPCRVGTIEMYRILERLTNGSGTPEDLATLEELCVMVRETSLCGLGQNAPNAITSTLHYFRHEYEQHIHGRSCAAGVCEMTEQPVSSLVPVGIAGHGAASSSSNISGQTNGATPTPEPA